LLERYYIGSPKKINPKMSRRAKKSVFPVKKHGYPPGEHGEIRRGRRPAQKTVDILWAWDILKEISEDFRRLVMTDNQEQTVESAPVQETKKIPQHVHLLCGWPLCIMFFGGAIGGALGGMLGAIAYFINGRIYKSTLPTGTKILLNIATGCSAIAIWLLFVVALAALFSDPYDTTPKETKAPKAESAKIDPDARVPFLTKYPDGGKKMEGQKDSKGRKQGRFSTYYKDGFLHEQGEYKDGLKIGKWTTFDQTGAVTLEKTYGEKEELLNTTKFKDGLSVNP
jgi:hypothetical protein